MRKFFIALAALTVAGTATPAFAQRGLASSEEIRDRMQEGIQRGVIDREEAGYLRGKLQQLRQQEREYSRGGYTRAEMQMLRVRSRSLLERLDRYESNDNVRNRYERDDRNDRRDRRDRRW